MTDQFKVDPYTDLPVCEICGAIIVKLELESKHDHYLESVVRLDVTFACGTTASGKQSKDRTGREDRFPNKEFTIPAKRFYEIKVDSSTCRNAPEIVRRLRKEQANAKQ